MDFSIGYDMTVLLIVIGTIITLLIFGLVIFILTLNEQLNYNMRKKELYKKDVLSQSERKLIAPHVEKQINNIYNAIRQLENEPFNTIKEKAEIDEVIDHYKENKERYENILKKLELKAVYRYVDIRDLYRAHFHR